MSAPSLTQLLIGLFGFSGETKPQKEQSPADTGPCEKEENSTMVIRNGSKINGASTHASRTAVEDESRTNTFRLHENVKILSQPTWGKDPQYAGRPYIEFVDVTPELAQEILDHRNENNRDISPHRVRMYAAIMARGSWTLASESISINEKGELCNGQHRLSAIVACEQTVPLEIKWNVPGDVQGGYDQNLSRPAWVNASLAFSARSGKQDPAENKRAKARMQEIASAIRAGFGTTARLLTDEYTTLCNKHSAGMRWFLSMDDQSKILAPVAGAIVYAYPIDPAAVEKFTRSYIAGEGATKGTPWFSLREQVPLKRHGRDRNMGQGEIFRRACGALVATLDKKKIYALRANDSHLILETRRSQMKGKK